ncbi:polyprenyl diphosphate synthase [Candidatus Gracilibacteria bacterium]|nr:polyprenyl diphosphate synthase [Candidatus Gracilibacteria bacterium]
MKNKNLNHLAIIMDGNRRWAKARFMPAIFGHKAGFDNVKKITRLANDKGITHLTLWALSTENLQKRPEDEIEGIIKLIGQVPKLIPEFMTEQVKLEMIGNIAKLPEDSQKILRDAKRETQNNTGIILTVALVYGGQDEIVRATKKIIEKGVDPESLNSKEFRKYLDTSILPIPDVIVRTGGDIRHSGFLLYDSAYSEYYFTDKKWPEFDETELDSVIDFFHGAKRNFGK